MARDGEKRGTGMGCMGFLRRRKRWWSLAASRRGMEEDWVDPGVAELVGGQDASGVGCSRGWWCSPVRGGLRLGEGDWEIRVKFRIRV